MKNQNINIDTFKKGLSISLIALKAMVPAVAPVTAATIAAFLTGCDDKKAVQEETFDANGFSEWTGLHKDTGKPWNPQGYDRFGERLFVDENEDGFDDISGFDKDGWKLESDGRYTWMDTGKEYNTNTGKKRDGSHWYDAQTGWDWKGWKEDGTYKDTGKTYDENGKNRDGTNAYNDKGWIDGENTNYITGKPHDAEGKDRNGEVWRDSNGWDWKGWKADGTYKNTNKPYDEQGNKQDGAKWYDGDGYDYEGFNAAGWDRDGYGRDGYDQYGWDRDDKHRTGGYYYQGYDRQGYDINGFHKDTKKHKETGTLYGPDGYDYQGYDINGLDKTGYDRNGFDAAGVHKVTGFKWNTTGHDKNGDRVHADGNPRDGYDDYSGKDINGDNPITPVAKATIGSGNVTGQASSSSRITTGQNNLYTMADDIYTQFNQYYSNNGPSALKTQVLSLSMAIANSGFISNGTDIAGHGITAVTRYIVTIGNLLPSEKKADFMKLMNAYRAKAYNDHRYQESNNPTAAELDGLFAELSSMGVTQANINTFFDTRVVAGISEELKIAPGLVKSLLNKIVAYEQFYANVDDIKAAGYRPATDTISPYTNNIPVRDSAYIQELIDEIELQQQSQGLGK